MTRRWLIVAATGALIAAAGVTWLVWPSSATDRFDLAGTLLLNGRTSHDGSGGCVGSGGYSDITEGAPVTVYDSTGTVIATGQLGGGDDRGWTPTADTERSNQCWFTFTVSVPNADFYQVEVSHRGKQTYKRSQAQSGSIALTLGP